MFAHTACTTTVAVTLAVPVFHEPAPVVAGRAIFADRFVCFMDATQLLPWVPRRCLRRTDDPDRQSPRVPDRSTCISGGFPTCRLRAGQERPICPDRYVRGASPGPSALDKEPTSGGNRTGWACRCYFP